MAKQINKSYRSKNNNKIPVTNDKAWPGRFSVYLALTALLIFTFLLFSGSLRNGFVNWDDPQYFFGNNLILDFSWTGIRDIFRLSSSILGTYQPLTTLSWMIDCKFWGFSPEIFHRSNLILHVINVTLAFYFARSMTGNNFISFFTAFFFAVHPMHVESVAWNSERKDVLYALFYLLSLITYLKYLKKNSKVWYLLLSCFLFGLSLLSKSMAVTLPLILIIIDYFQDRKIFSKKCLSEKIPFFVLSIIFSIINFQSQQKGLSDLSITFSAFDRIFLVTYALSFYIVQLVFPLNLSILHYYPELHNGAMPVVFYLSFFFVATIVWLIIKSGKERKYILTGFLFFFISILPVIQLIPVGMAMASERYTYIPYIGLLLIIFIFFQKLSSGSKFFRPLIYIIITGFSIYFSFLTWNRVKVWENDFSLWGDFVSANPDYFYGYYGLGGAYDKQKNYPEEINCFSKCISLNPLFYRAWADRGMAKDYNNDMHGAIDDYLKAIELDPDNDGTYNNLAVDNYKMKKYDVAKSYYLKSLTINPNNSISWMNLGLLYLTLNDTANACDNFYHAHNLRYPGVEPYIQKFCKNR